MNRTIQICQSILPISISFFLWLFCYLISFPFQILSPSFSYNWMRTRYLFLLYIFLSFFLSFFLYVFLSFFLSLCLCSCLALSIRCALLQIIDVQVTKENYWKNIGPFQTGLLMDKWKSRGSFLCNGEIQTTGVSLDRFVVFKIWAVLTLSFWLFSLFS